MVFFLLSCLGATFIINFSYIFKKIREKIFKASPFFGKLLKCPQCTGFWVGIFIRITEMLKMGTLQHIHIYDICYGFASSFICYVAYLLLKYFMNKYD